MNRLTDPHAAEADCINVHCHAHAVDEPAEGAYRVCLECGHVFPAAADLLADHAALVEGLNVGAEAGELLTAKTDPERITVCPHCAHDF